MSVKAANVFVHKIINACNDLESLPYRGRTRSDIHPGLRVLGLPECVVVACDVQDETVFIVDLFSRGQNYESALLREQLR